MSKENKYLENWDRKCEVCGSSPCVDVVDDEGKVEHSFDLCGVCCFGTAQALDPDEWDEI